MNSFFNAIRRWMGTSITPPTPPVTAQHPPWHLDWVTYKWDQSEDTSESEQTIICDGLWIHTN